MGQQLKEKYGLPVATTVAVGIVVGIGIFFKAEGVLAAGGLNPVTAIAAWTLAGIMTILAGLTISEISAMTPDSGGIISYVRKIYGDFAAYVTGWMHVSLYVPGLLATIAYYFALFAWGIVGISSPSALQIALLAIPMYISVFAVHLYKPEAGGKLQTVITIVKMLPLLAIFIFGFLNGNVAEPFALPVIEGAKSFNISLLFAALVPCAFAYDGWIGVGMIGSELKNAQKNLPRAIVMGLSLVILLYVGMNVALLKTMPAGELTTAGAAQILFGPVAARLFFLAIAVSAFGGFNGFSLAAIRYPYAMALRNELPFSKKLAKVDPKYNTPFNAGLLIAVIGLVYLMIPLLKGAGAIDAISEVPVAVIWIFYTMIFVGVILLRKRDPEAVRPYKVPLYPVVPILAAISGLIIAGAATKSNPMAMLYSAIVIGAGAVMYKIRGKKVKAAYEVD